MIGSLESMRWSNSEVWSGRAPRALCSGRRQFARHRHRQSDSPQPQTTATEHPHNFKVNHPPRPAQPYARTLTLATPQQSFHSSRLARDGDPEGASRLVWDPHVAQAARSGRPIREQPVPDPNLESSFFSQVVCCPSAEARCRDDVSRCRWRLRRECTSTRQSFGARSVKVQPLTRVPRPALLRG